MMARIAAICSSEDMSSLSPSLVMRTGLSAAANVRLWA
jgi:hypothetical protein